MHVPGNLLFSINILDDLIVFPESNLLNVNFKILPYEDF